MKTRLESGFNWFSSGVLVFLVSLVFWSGYSYYMLLAAKEEVRINKSSMDASILKREAMYKELVDKDAYLAHCVDTINGNINSLTVEVHGLSKLMDKFLKDWGP